MEPQTFLIFSYFLEILVCELFFCIVLRACHLVAKVFMHLIGESLIPVNTRKTAISICDIFHVFFLINSR